MIWLNTIKYALLVLVLVYLFSAAVMAIFIMLMGGPFWVAIKSGLIIPFMWLRLI